MPKYVNRGGQSREKCMVTSYDLVKNHCATQSAVAAVMGCTQGTISNWVNKMAHKDEVDGLKKELTRHRDFTNEMASRLEEEGHIIEYRYVEEEEDA